MAADNRERVDGERVVRVRIADGRLGTAEAGPDGRFFITLDDQRSILVDAGEVTVDASASVSS